MINPDEKPELIWIHLQFNSQHKRETSLNTFGSY